MTSIAVALNDNPFPGLRPFQAEEEHLFFGREEQIDAMLNKLAETHFLAVVGTSGSGKSSLVNCGLRPALQGGFMAGAGSSWRVAQFRPGSDPIGAMALSLSQNSTLFNTFKSGASSITDIINATLRMGKGGLIDIYKQARLDPQVNLLIIVDQFEELFRYQNLAKSDSHLKLDNIQDSIAFVNLLLEIRKVNYPIYIVLTMRSDFLGDCAQFSGLAEAINDGQYLVPRLNRNELRHAITGPIRVGRADISPVLLTRLVNDVGDNPDQLSILQHALNRTWTRWQYQGNNQGPIKLSHYEAIGTMEYALDRHAEKAYEELKNDHHKIICKKIFQALTDKANDPRGVRYPTKLKQLCELLNVSSEDVIAVINVFRKPSRSFLMPPEPEPLEMETVVDISHESLMRIWTRLGTWVDQEAESANMYKRLADTVARYRSNKASLLRDPELGAVLDWKKLMQPNPWWAKRYNLNWDSIENFIQDSLLQRNSEIAKQEQEQKFLEEQNIREAKNRERELAQKRELQQLRRSRRALFCMFCIMLLALGFGIYQMFSADQRRKDAEILSDIIKAQIFFGSDLHIESLISGILLSPQVEPNSASEMHLITTLQQTVSSIEEYNRLEKHSNWVRVVQYSPDGQQIATGSADGTVQIWTESGVKRKTITLDAPVNSLSFSPDSSLLVIGTDRNEAELWDITNAQMVRLTTLAGHDGEVNSVSFSPDGQMIVTGSYDKTVKLWNLQGELLRTLEGHTDSVTVVSFAPDGEVIASGSHDQTVKLWRIDGSQISTDPIEHQDTVRSVVFSPDSRLIATGGDDNLIMLWDGKTGEFRDRLEGHQLYVRSVAFSPDGSTLASASFDSDVKLWDLNNQGISEIQSFEHHSEPVLSVSFSPDGKRLASGSADTTVKIFNLERQPIPTLDGHLKPVWSVDFSHDGRFLATGSQDSTVNIWHLDSGRPDENHLINTISLENKAITEESQSIWAVRFHPTQNILAVSSPDNTVDLYRINNADGQHNLLMTLKGHTESIRSLSFSPDGEFLATGSDDKTVRIWGLDGELLEAINAKMLVSSVSFSPDSKMIAVGGNDPGSNNHPVSIFNISGDLIRQYPSSHSSQNSTSATRLSQGHVAPVRTVEFSFDGRTLATGSNDQNIKLWNVSTGELLHTLEGHSGSILSLSFRPGDQAIVSASEDQTIRLWGTDGQLLSLTTKRYPEHEAPVNAVSFSPNGKFIATGSNDTTVKLWNFDLEDLISQGCHLLSDYLNTHPQAYKKLSVTSRNHNRICARTISE